MARKTKSWADKMQTGVPHVDILEKDFAGVPAGSRLLISSPTEIARYLSEQLPPGQTLQVPALRQALAARHRADATCPLTTSIFLRIVAEDAWDRLEAGAAIDEVTPFWRAIDPKSPLAKKLRAGPDWIAARRKAELQPASKNHTALIRPSFTS